MLITYSQLFFILSLLIVEPMIIFDFNKDSNLENWVIVNDVVMGGRSDSKFYLNNNGHWVFEGQVSLENNGGFSSLRHGFTKKDVKNHSKVIIRLKGDGKRYQFRIKSNVRDRYSYISYFETNGDWQTIEILFKDMYPSFRGTKLNLPNYSGKTVEEVSFLIGNKKAESFKLLIDNIYLK